MSEYLKHHFVPQFCLREFANDVKHRQIGTYLLERRQYIGSTSIRSQAQRAKLYGSDKREKTLSALESASAVVLQNIVANQETPIRHSEDHRTLLVHVLFQAMRTPAAAEIMEESVDKNLQIVMSHDEKMSEYAGRVRIGVKNAAAHMLSYAAQAFPFCWDLQYKLLRNPCATPFVLSDHPVIRYNQFVERRNVEFGSTGFGCRGLQMFLPLSPRVLLMFYDADVYRVGRDSSSRIVDLTSADVDALNVLQVINAGSQLFFNAEITEAEIRDLVQRSEKWMLRERVTVRELPQSSPDGRRQGSVVMTTHNDIRTNMRLSGVVELPSAQKFRITDEISSVVRDRRMYEQHFDFDQRVSAGLYKRTEFQCYMDDVNSGKVRRFFEAT